MARTRVVMVVIDAMPHRHVSPTLTPNLWAQVEQGGRAPDGGESLPVSVTYSNHAAFVTGVDPSVSGVHGNHTWVEGSGWEKSPRVGPCATTLFERVAAAGGRSVVVVGDHKLIGQMGAEHADVAWPPAGRIPDGTERCEFGYPSDAAVVAAVRATDLAADLVVLHLNQPDTTSHLHGPDSPQAIDQYRATDAAYGQLVTELQQGWEDTVLVTLSDHDQETITDQSAVALVAALEGTAVEVATEGTAALLHGTVDAALLEVVLAVPGVEGARQLSRHEDGDVWMVWSVPGRMFDTAPIPLLGQHGSPRCRTQLAVVSGGHDAVPALVESIRQRRPSVLDWAPTVSRLLALEVPA